MDMAARILDKLRQSPFSIEELAVALKRKPFEFRLSVNALLREGSIVKLDNDLEDGPSVHSESRPSSPVRTRPGIARSSGFTPRLRADQSVQRFRENVG
jgi:hypothetical protein